MVFKFAVLIGFLSGHVLQVSAINCFLSNTSYIRREAIKIIPGLRELACQTLCMNNVACSAMQITTTGNCVHFGAVITATLGECPAPFTCQLKTTSGCVPKARRAIDQGWIRNYCSGTIVRAPIDDGTPRPCGSYASGNRDIYIEFDNHYLAPAGCECDPLPMDLPVSPGFSNPSPARINVNPLCTTTRVQFRFLHACDKISDGQSIVVWPVNRKLYCANKVWMQVLETGPTDSACAVTAVSCVV